MTALIDRHTASRPDKGLSHLMIASRSSRLAFAHARGGLVATLMAAMCVSACTLPHTPPVRSHPWQATPQACSDWMVRLDDHVRTHGVGDAQDHRLAGFGHLRTNRFESRFALNGDMTPAQTQAWHQAMAALDAAARRHEVANLPGQVWVDLNTHTVDEAQRRTAACGATLLQTTLQSPRDVARVREAVLTQQKVADDYSIWLRALGAYPLTKVPFFAGVNRWQRNAQSNFERFAQLPLPDTSRRYTLAEPRPTATQIKDLLVSMQRDALGVPRPSAREAQALLQAYAPAYDIDTLGPHDQPGALRWRHHASAFHAATQTTAQGAPGVDTQAPTVYARVTHTHWGGKPRLQLVYTVWFVERPKVGLGGGPWGRDFDLLGGPLDGVMWRLTLGPDGQVWMHDTIHPCGCYHQFVPTAQTLDKPGAPQDVEWAFTPARLAAHDASSTVTLRLQSGTHHVVQATLSPPSRSAAPYVLVDEDSLRSLPWHGDQRKSLYGIDGLVAGTERLERVLFWPMGIASAGAMRQWGRHATAFVGRRHFDDADLLEARFQAPASDLPR
jgi:hypothetical protein